MFLEEIKNRIEELNYSSYVKDELLLVGFSKEYNEEMETFLIESVFSVEIKDRIVIKYHYKQIPKSKEFSSIEELIDFISEKFPLNSL